ncbi:MAG: AAA domain-containing protein, partial [Halobacteriovoraceae bacterium]|nr:AAA domain-containing protein [Halobacteriovoraceae bacterium]
DILGSSIFNKESSSFDFHKGPIFGELILADELNRAPPKTQSALLQAMEEKNISIEGANYILPEHFSVIATQNPHKQIGTFSLPESQLDRFSMKLKMGYPDKESTLELLKQQTDSKNVSGENNKSDQLTAIKKHIEKINIADEIYELIYSLLDRSRTNNELIPLSNRCGLDLVRVSRSWAYLQDRDYVIPDDIHYLFPYVTGHRLVHPESSDIDYEHKVAGELLKNI